MGADDHWGVDGYPHQCPIAVRLGDYNFANHVDNTKFYVYFSEAVHSLLSAIEVNWESTDSIPYVAESQCRFLASIPFDTDVTAGIGISHVGTSSLRYEIALFIAGRAEPVGVGHVVHVFVDRASERPTPMPARVRDGAQAFHISAP